MATSTAFTQLLVSGSGTLVFSVALRPETVQTMGGHLDFHTVPESW